MINFHHSTFTWKTRPWSPDPNYRYAGGFVGELGQVYHVRFNIEARCEVRDESTGHQAELFLGADCRSEYTIAYRNLFQVPSAEWRMAFSRESRLTIARKPSDEQEEVSFARLRDIYQEHHIDLRSYPDSRELTEPGQIVEATLANLILGARSTYVEQGLTVSVEYPVNIINVNQADGEFQVCTGPVVLPDLATWDGREVTRVFLAHVAISQLDYVEFILQREVDAAEAERRWMDRPRGRDRFELLDSSNPPPDYPPARPRLTTYNETWELEATNVVMCAENR